MEVGLRGATVTDVARRHAASRSQLRAWRRDLKRHGALRPVEPANGRAVFVPVAPPPLPAPLPGFEAAEAAAPMSMSDPAARADAGAEGVEDTGADAAGTFGTIGSVEIVLANGRRLCVPAGIEDAALARLIRLVEGA